MLFRRRARHRSLSRFVTIATIAVTPASTLIGLWLYLANIDPDIKVPVPTLPVPNAYDDYVAAGQMVVRGGDIRHALEASEAAPQKVFSRAEKEALVRVNQPALSRLRRGFAHDYFEPPARSYAATFPHYARYRDLGCVLSLEGQMKAALGDYSGAMDSYLDAVEFGQVISRGSSLIGRLVGSAIQEIGRKPAWNSIVRLDGPSARNAARRMEMIDAKETPYADTIREEMWIGQAGIMELFHQGDHWRIGDPCLCDEHDQYPQGIAFRFWFTVYGKRRTLNNYTCYMEALTAQARQPYSVNSPDVPLPPDPMSRILVSEFAHVRFDDVAGLQTPNALLTISLSLQAYRAEHGAYPASLAQLAPGYLKAVPVDPFGHGAPLRYRRAAESYRLYSVGPDGRDDGGKAIDDPAKGNDPRWRYRPEENSKGDIVAGINIYG